MNRFILEKHLAIFVQLLKKVILKQFSKWGIYACMADLRLHEMI